MPVNRAVIFVNGDLPNLQAVRDRLLPGDYLIAADAGASHILRLGLIPDLLIGDLDSLPPADSQVLDQAGVVRHHYPADKDQTDLELALQAAIKKGYDPIRIVAALGRRLDMTLSNLALLARPSLLDLDIRLDDGQDEVFFIHRKATIEGSVGDTVSLLAWGDTPAMVRTTGLRWVLNDEPLHPSETRGISNLMLADQAEITVSRGLLLCIHHLGVI